MAAQSKRKPFRIERQTLNKGANDAGKELTAADQHIAVMDRLQEILGKLDDMGEVATVVAATPKEKPEAQTESAASSIDAEAFRRQIVEAETLRHELQDLSNAIQRTKDEILSLRHNPTGQDKIATAGEALRAVVSDTENATNGIIESVEAMEELSGRIAALAPDGSVRELTESMGEHVIQIFEHCNFQDITGQRITKVVQTMEFIDERIAKMIDIWGGSDAFDWANLSAGSTVPAGEVLEGPSAAPDTKISQDDIDKLFD